MKKKIDILGSTGSIGKNLIKIIEKNSSEFNLILLTTYKNYQEMSSLTTGKNNVKEKSSPIFCCTTELR